MDFYNLLKEDQDVILEMVDLFNPLCSDEKPYMNYEVFYMWGCEVDEEDEEDVVYGGHEYKINKTSDDDLISDICYKGKLISLKYLIEEKNADFRSLGPSDDNLLFSAAWGGRPDVLSHLLNLGLDPNHQDEEDRTPLMCVVEAGGAKHPRLNDYLKCIEILTEAGSNVLLKDKYGHDACLMVSRKSVEVQRILIHHVEQAHGDDNDRRVIKDLRARWKDKDSGLEDCIRHQLINGCSYTEEDAELALQILREKIAE